MSHLEVRRIPFNFDGVEFLWNPDNPAFSIMMNQISFFAIGLEKYFCLAFRDAEPLITDAEIAEEARLFRRQEAVHSQAHKLHVKALVSRYPELEGTLDKVIAHYDKLYESESLDYHLAYAGGLEATFTPFFGMLLNHRQPLFAGGDARVASLLIWHFCEEIEHCSSALAVFNHVVGRPWYRLAKIAAFKRHAGEAFAMLAEDFKKYVPEVPENHYRESPLAAIPRSAKLRALLGVIDSQMPWHNPDKQSLPDYYRQWLDHWNAGEDVTQIYGRPVTETRL